MRGSSKTYQEEQGDQTPALEGDLLSIGQTARALGVTVPTIRNWDRDGRLTAVRMPSGHRRFRRSDVERVVAGQ